APDRRVLRLEEAPLVGGAVLHLHPEGRGLLQEDPARVPRHPGRPKGPGPTARAQQAVIRRFSFLLVLLGASCVYEVGNLYELRDVKGDMFDTQSERGTHEFDLTDAIVREISARGIRVNARDAAYTLKGRILDIRTPSLVDQKGTDQVL